MTQGPPSAELEVRVKMRSRHGKVNRGLSGGSGRPAGHASALQTDGSHRLHSQRSLVRVKEEAWSGPLAGGGTMLQVPSLARASTGHRQPGRQSGGPGTALGKASEQRQATRVRPQSARKELNTAANGDSAGFQVPATRSQCTSDPGSGPRTEVACTQHRVRAAAGCAHNGRPRTGAGQDANRRQFRDQVSQGRHVRNPGQRARGQTSQATTRRDLMSQTAVTVAAHPRSSPDIVRFTVFCQARNTTATFLLIKNRRCCRPEIRGHC